MPNELPWYTCAIRPCTTSKPSDVKCVQITLMYRDTQYRHGRAQFDRALTPAEIEKWDLVEAETPTEWDIT